MESSAGDAIPVGMIPWRRIPAGRTRGTGGAVASPPIAFRFLERLCAAAERVQARQGAVCASGGLAEPRRRLLAALSHRGDQGCSQTELAAILGLPESSLCMLVDRMQAEGLLYRFRSKADRRKSLLMLTHPGRERLQAVRDRLEALIRSWLEDVSDDELERLGAWLDGLALSGDVASTAGCAGGDSPEAEGLHRGLDGDSPRWKEAG
jgi:DNA-binding MarR family transcriptional regulator